MTLSLAEAICRANVAPSEFYDHWKAKVQVSQGSESGKKELVELLEKAGVRGVCNNAQRLEQQIWFVNEVVGRNVARVTEAQNVRAHTCIHACIHN